MHVQPYVFFEGRCQEAIAFYEKAIGAKPGMVMRYKENPEGCPPGINNPELVMHASFTVGRTQIMAADGYGSGTPKFEGFSLTLTADSDSDAARLFAALSEGGNVLQPIITTFFASSFGMVADKFGVSWMILAGNNTDCPDEVPA